MPPKFNDLTNKKIGKLTVLGLSKYTKDRCYYWDCLCECGVSTIVKATSLINEKTKSCGCLKKTHFHNLTRLKFGQVTVTKYLGKNSWNCYKYSGICDCGAEFIFEGNDLKSCKIKSCGCLKNKKQKENANYKLTLIKSVYQDYRNKAAQRNYDFSLSLDQFSNFIFSDCYICGVKGGNTKYSRKKEHSINYNGVDRVDNNEGYNFGNCRAACYVCNQAKHRMSMEAFKSWIDRIIIFKENKQGTWVND